MRNIKNFVIAFVCFVVFVSVYLFGVTNRTEPTSIGSVAPGNEYQSTTTDATFLNAAKLLATGNGSLAQVTITTAGVGSLTFYDATTTNPSLRTKSATTTLANFQITTTVGTYTFDSLFFVGLIAEFKGTNTASSTITLRSN